MEDELLELTNRMDRFDTELKSILKKHVPVSAQRLDKVYLSIKETLDVFSLQLAEEQNHRKQQNDKITTLSKEVQDLKRQIVVLSALNQKGMPVPK